MQELPFTYRELLGTRSLAVQGAALACLIALFAFIGPFGTYDSIGPLGRIGYWVLTMGANWLVCASVMMLTLRVTSSAPMRTRLLAMAGAALAAAVPGTGVVHTAEVLFRPDYEGHNALPTIYLGVAVLMLAISALVVSFYPDVGAIYRARKRRPAKRKPRTGQQTIFWTVCHRNLAATSSISGWRTTMWRAFTTAGSTLVLMRFADAVAALEDAGGLRVHRSYWVAKKHVTGTARRNARTTLRLTGGHEAPVSRGYLPAVRQAGLM